MKILGACLISLAVLASEPSQFIRYSSDKTNCVDYARDLQRVAERDDKQFYFVVGFTLSGRPHVFIVVDGVALDNGAVSPRVFPEQDIKKHMRKWWIVDRLPKKAVLVFKDGNLVGITGEVE